MSNTIIYRPYKSEGWFIPFSIACSIFSFVATGFTIFNIGLHSFVLATMGCASVWLTKLLYDASKAVVLFSEHGLGIICIKHNVYKFYRWEEISHAYYVRNYKGHLFLVLSSQSLTRKEAKKMANRSANFSRICFDSVVVLHIDVLQDVSQLKEIMENHTLFIVYY